METIPIDLTRHRVELILIVFTGLILAGSSYLMYQIPPFLKGPQGFKVTGHPIFYMLPFAFGAYVAFGLTLISGILYLYKKQLTYDIIALSAATTGLLFAIITTVIGIFWSYVEWGYFWQWEPRQTATLMMIIIYAGFLAFRTFVDEREQRASLSSIYAIVAFPSVPLSYLIVGALHPVPGQTAYSRPIMPVVMVTFFGLVLLLSLVIWLIYSIQRTDEDLIRIRNKILSESA